MPTFPIFTKNLIASYLLAHSAKGYDEISKISVIIESRKSEPSNNNDTSLGCRVHEIIAIECCCFIAKKIIFNN